VPGRLADLLSEQAVKKIVGLCDRSGVEKVCCPNWVPRRQAAVKFIHP
jgi:hypothetical protein